MNNIPAAPARAARRRFPWIAYAIVLAGIILAAAAPLISVLIAGTIANAHGCALDEGSVHPCIVGGADRGELLYTMCVLGWLMFFTVPAGALAFLLWLTALVVHLFVRKRRLAAAAPAALVALALGPPFG